MAFELEFSPSEINQRNLRRLSRDQSIVEERRICELSELAYSACTLAGDLYSSGMNLSEIVSYMSDGLTVTDSVIHTDALPQNKDRLLCYQSFSSAYDRAVFAQLLVDGLIRAGIPVAEENFLRQGRVGNVFTYVKNQYSDEAFDVFSESVHDPRVSYSASLAEAVKKLVAGTADFCLLPLEERGGVRLPTVSELIYANDLKINAVTPVFGYTGNGEVKYAMISKNFIIEDYSDEDDRYLEIRLESDSGRTVTELGLAAEVFGVEIYRINTFTAITEDGPLGNYSAVLRITGADFLPFLVYSALFLTECTPMGLYKNLE